MTQVSHRLSTTVSSWLRNVPWRYTSSALTLCILGLGVSVVLLVQPAPSTFTEGWSAPREIDEVRLNRPHRAAMDRQDHIHLAWQKQVDHKLVAFYARLDRHGQLIGEPIRLSSLDADAENVALVLTSDNVPLCFWIEKGHGDDSQRLMMARPGTGESPQILLTSPAVMRDLTATADVGDEQDLVFLAWSDNRQGLYDIYVTILDSQGNPSVSERRVTDTGTDLVFQPTLAAGGGVVHLVYFFSEVFHQNLVHQACDVAGEPLTGPQVLERAPRSRDSVQRGYPLLAVADADGRLRLYESLGSLVRQTKIDKDGTVVQSAEPLLSDSHYYAQVNLARVPDQHWLVWTTLRRSSDVRFQVYAALLDEAGRLQEATRLTFASSSALWPVMLLDGKGGQHVIWQQGTEPSIYQMMYINNLDPAPISIWQRLGFAGDRGGWNFLLILAGSIILAVILLLLNVWQLATAWAVTALGLQITRRVGAIPHASRVVWTVLLAALFLAVRPEADMLGQMPIDVAGATHWVMGAVASAVVVYVGRIWQDRLHSILIWAGMAGLWLWIYYFLNSILILREGFAV
jgi:hypothetical protein